MLHKLRVIRHTTSAISVFLLLSFIISAGCGEAPQEPVKKPNGSPSVVVQPTVPDKNKQPTETPTELEGKTPTKEPQKEETHCLQEQYQQAPLSGRLWKDINQLGLTDAKQGIPDPEEDSVEGVAGAKVSVVLPGAKKLDATTCPDGRFYFDENALEGNKVGVFDFQKSGCTTANCPRKLAELAGKRAVKVVTFGDSIPSYPHGEQWFPEFLVDVAKPVAEINNVNVAIPGTRTYDWLPGKKNFEEQILPNKDADIFIFSLGGNNVLLDSYVGLLIALIPGELNRRIESAKKKVDKAFEEGREIIDEIKKIAPDAEILWVSYMDYTNSFHTLMSIPRKWKRDAIETFLTESFVKQREQIAGYKGVLALDMYGISQQKRSDGSDFNNEDYLISDGIHLNQRGHYFYAAQVFRALGGFFIGQKVVGDQDNSNIFENLGTHRSIGYPTSP